MCMMAAIALCSCGGPAMAQRGPASAGGVGEGFRLERVSDTLHVLRLGGSRWELPFPVYRFQVADVNGDGSPDAIVGVVKPTRHDPEVRRRVFRTALRRFITGPDRLAYLRILTKGRYDADRFARSASSRYLSFAMVWPTIVSALWGDRVIASAILSTGQVAPRAAHAAPAAPESDPLADTGAFPVQGGGC